MAKMKQRGPCGKSTQKAAWQVSWQGKSCALGYQGGEQVACVQAGLGRGQDIHTDTLMFICAGLYLDGTGAQRQKQHVLLLQRTCIWFPACIHIAHNQL